MLITIRNGAVAELIPTTLQYIVNTDVVSIYLLRVLVVKKDIVINVRNIGLLVLMNMVIFHPTIILAKERDVANVEIPILAMIVRNARLRRIKEEKREKNKV